MAITLTDNEFFTGLTNLALVVRLYATNTSRTPDDFIDSFATDTLSFGNAKIFPFSDLPQVMDYSETSSVLKVTKVPVNEEVIRITEKKYIPSSYSAYILEMAFTDESGMNAFIGYLLGQMESAKTDYIYDAIIADLFAKNFAGAKQNNNITLLDTSTIQSAGDLSAAETINQKRITIALQNEIDNISVFNSDYNAKGYKQALAVGDMKFIFCNPYKNENLVNLYASLLKSDVINDAFKRPEMYTIPQVKIPANAKNVVGWLMHKKAYQYFYKFVFMGNFFDPSNLVINNFLHFWYGKGFLDNLPAIKFTASAPAAAK